MEEPAILLGHSTGGLVAALLAGRYPEWVRAAILAEPVPWVPPEGHWVYDYFARCRELTSMGKTAEELRELLQPKQAGDRETAKRMSELDRGPVDAFFDRSHWEGFEAEEMLRSISCPTLFLYGDWEKGSELTPDQVEIIKSSLPGCVSDFLDAGHVLHKGQPVQMARIIMDFLESL